MRRSEEECGSKGGMKRDEEKCGDMRRIAEKYGRD